MGIGDIGWSELIVLLALALILLGPRRLPEIANALGRSLREFRRALNEVQDELRRETQVSPMPWNKKFEPFFDPPSKPPEPEPPQPEASQPKPSEREPSPPTASEPSAES